MLKYLDSSAEVPEYTDEHLKPHIDLVSVDTCLPTHDDNYLCACGPGSWDIGEYMGKLRKNCARCQV